MMLYIRAEREGDWLLHLHAVSVMMPYFFAAGHHNYARYGTYYLQDMRKLPHSILDKFLHGEHTTRHHRNFSLAFIEGSANLRTSSLKDHARSTMHEVAMRLLKKAQSASVFELCSY